MFFPYDHIKGSGYKKQKLMVFFCVQAFKSFHYLGKICYSNYYLWFPLSLKGSTVVYHVLAM